MYTFLQHNKCLPSAPPSTINGNHKRNSRQQVVGCKIITWVDQKVNFGIFFGSEMTILPNSCIFMTKKKTQYIYF